MLCLVLALESFRWANEKGLLLLGIAALVFMAATLALGWSTGVAVSVLLLAVELVAARATVDTPISVSVALYATVLLLMAELAFWSLDARILSDDDDQLWKQHGIAILILVVASLAVGLLGVAVARLDVDGNLLLLALGGAAAVLAIAVVASLTRRIER